MDSHSYSLAKCLEVSLRVLAPITPYLSEDLYVRCANKLPEIFLSLPSLLEAPFPRSTDDFGASRDLELETRFDRILEAVGTIRNALAHVASKSDAESESLFTDRHSCAFFSKSKPSRVLLIIGP